MAKKKAGYRVGSLPPEGYLARFNWAQAQLNGKLRQAQCPYCHLWLFPQEYKIHSCPRPAEAV